MNGLDKIIAQILDDAKQESLAIQEKAAISYLFLFCGISFFQQVHSFCSSFRSDENSLILFPIIHLAFPQKPFIEKLFLSTLSPNGEPSHISSFGVEHK